MTSCGVVGIMALSVLIAVSRKRAESRPPRNRPLPFIYSTSSGCGTYSPPSQIFLGPSPRDPYPTILSDLESEEDHHEMVQAYHAVPAEHDGDDIGRGAEHEGSALLGSRASSAGLARSKAQREGHATLTSTLLSYLSAHGHGLLCHDTQACSPFLGYVCPSTVVRVGADLICVMIGPCFCGRHPGHVDLRVFWFRRVFWSVSPLCLCAPDPAPPLVLLRCRKPHLPSRGRFLRRGHCYKVLRGIYQVRPYRSTE